MAITVENRTNIVGLVVGMFGAAPGASVLSDLVASFEAGATLKQIAANVANTTEFTSIFPTFLTNEEFATKVVNQLVGNEVVAAEKAAAVVTLTTMLNGGQSRTDVFVDAITAVNALTATNAAWANAGAAFDNKVEVAVYYSVEKQLSASTLSALQDVVKNVTSAASTVTDAKAIADNTETAGTTFTFTTGTDTFTGTTSNDTFVGSDATMAAADSIVGGAGTDTLNYTNSAAGAALPVTSISGVEVMNVRAVTNAVTSGDLSLVNGLTTFNSDRSNAAITVTNLAAGGEFGIIGNGAVTNAAAANFGSVAGATAQTLNVSGGTLGTSAVALTGTGVKATTINSTGAANKLGTVAIAASSTGLTINATTDLTTAAITAAGVVATDLTLSGAGKITTDLNAVAATKLTVSNAGAVSTGILNNATVTVDASASTGGVTTTLGTSTAMKFTGGAGADNVTVGSILGTGAAVNGGDGTDRIAFTANGQLTAVSGSKITNFEVLQATGVTDIDMDNIAGITAIRTSGAVTIADLTATQAGAITVLASGALNFGVKGAATVGQLDTVAITTSSTNTAVAIATLAVADVETISLTANTGTGLTSIATLAHDDWATLTLSGASAITINSTATAATINTAINGSAATGILTLNFANSTTNGVSITGGSAADVLTGTGQDDVINGGAGKDVIVGGAGNDTIDGGDGDDTITGGAGINTVTGGAGADKFVFSTADVDTTAGAVTDIIVDFVSGTDTISATVNGAGTALNYLEATVAVADLTTLLAAADAALAGAIKYYVGQVGSDSYLVTDADANGYTDVIKLTGVALTGIAFADIVA